jgi:dihydrofolate reductase
MRKLVLHMITSLDGFIADREDNVNPATQWDEEMHSHYLDLFSAAGSVVFGRRLYEQYVGHWSQVAVGEISAENDLELRWTRRLMAMPKLVVSTTIDSDPDSNTDVVRDDVARELTELKATADGDMLLMCGPALVAQLATRNIIDEYMLYVCPVALGDGVPLFGDLTEPVRLAYQRTRAFSSGVNLQYYTPAR